MSRVGAPSWEILPQQAEFPEVILSKRHELGIFSNFAPTRIVFRERTFASIEGLWQSMLYPEDEADPRMKFPGIVWRYTRDEVAQMVGFEAKRAGDLASENMKKMNINWVSFDKRRFAYHTPERGEHYNLIFEALLAKHDQHEEVRKLLAKTAGLTLKPDHHQESNAPPAWHYHKMWMEIRALRNGPQPAR